MGTNANIFESVLGKKYVNMLKSVFKTNTNMPKIRFRVKKTK